jgi:hypothetical protein
MEQFERLGLHPDPGIASQLWGKLWPSSRRSRDHRLHVIEQQLPRHAAEVHKSSSSPLTSACPGADRTGSTAVASSEHDEDDILANVDQETDSLDRSPEFDTETCYLNRFELSSRSTNRHPDLS